MSGELTTGADAYRMLRGIVEPLTLGRDLSYHIGTIPPAAFMPEGTEKPITGATVIEVWSLPAATIPSTGGQAPPTQEV